jgi:Uroporphyrinogen decarboxylase (URO-D)
MNVPTSPAREAAPFSWFATCSMPIYTTLAGVRYDRLFHEADAIVEAYEKGRPLALELYGPDVALAGPALPGISYGHVNCLGSELIFPEDSEVAHTPVYGSLDEGIRALKADVDFEKQGMFPFYLNLWEELKARLPNETIAFRGFKSEGPITTAWALRGEDFFADVLLQPEKTNEYIACVTESILKYRRLIARINGEPENGSGAVSLADDIAAMISPAHWPDMVLPHLQRYFEAQNPTYRNAHIEDLAPGHLKHLDTLGLDMFDPSVSEKLTPELIRDGCSVPFAWRLYSMIYPTLTVEEVGQWVFDAVSQGASRVFTSAARNMDKPEDAAKLNAFIRAAKDVEQRLKQDCP